MVIKLILKIIKVIFAIVLFFSSINIVSAFQTQSYNPSVLIVFFSNIGWFALASALDAVSPFVSHLIKIGIDIQKEEDKDVI